MSRAVAITHRNYTIKAMQVGTSWQARAYATGARSGAGDLCRASAPSQAEVVTMLKTQLDERDQKLASARRFEASMDFCVPTQEEYRLALDIAALSDAQRVMLEAHAKAGNTGMTATELAHAGGYADFSTANLQYGLAGAELADALRLGLPRSKLRDEPLATAVIAAWHQELGDGNATGRWIMYPELRNAVSDQSA